MFRNERKRASRRGWPIMGYVGANGGGKSAAMVWDTIPSLRAGRPVLSTVRLLDYDNPRECPGCPDPHHYRPVFGPIRVEDLPYMRLDPDAREDLTNEFLNDDDGGDRPVRRRIVRDGNGFPVRDVIGTEVHKMAHPMWVPFTHWQQLLDARGCDILLDEVTGVASSRESMGMPAPVANKLVQLRRADVIVRWTSPSWARADKIIRECSQAVTYCRGFLPKVSGGGDRQWRQRRMFRWQTYDADSFEDFTSGKREQLVSLTNDWHWGPRSPAFLAYDTFDAVSAIGTVSDAGACYQCGGLRPRPKCSCPPPGDTPSPAEPGGKAEGRSGRSRPAVAAPVRPRSIAVERGAPVLVQDST